jgi:hypothetical protein
MGTSVSVKVIKDTKGAGVAALQRRLQSSVQRVLIGVPAGKTDSDGNSLVEVAAWTEFGTSTAPERPFLRGGIREALPLCRRLAANDLRAVAEGRMTLPMALERQGIAAVGVVKQYMTGSHFVPNSPRTIAKKGSSQPTIDSGALRQAVASVVESR